MNERHLKNFIAVAELGNMSAAAGLLYISPQALHQQMNLLEREMGCKLLNRNKNGVSLTRAGRVFYKRAREAANSLEKAHAEIKELLRARENTVIVGHNGYIHDPSFFTALGEFRKAYPEITMNMRIQNLRDSAELDTVLSDVPNMPEFDREGLMYVSPFFFIMHRSNPLAEKRALELADLYGQILTVPPFALMEQLQLDIWRAIGRERHRFQLVEQRSLESESIINLHDSPQKAMLSWGPNPSLAKELVQLPIEGFGANVSFFYRSKGTKPAAKAYMDFMINYYQKHWDKTIKAFIPG